MLVTCLATLAVSTQPLLQGTAAATGRIAQIRGANGVEIDGATGCPTQLIIERGAHCVSWPVDFDVRSVHDKGGCGQQLFMLEPLNSEVDEYVALWSWLEPNQNPPPDHPWMFTSVSGGPYGEEAWSTSKLTPENTGAPINYDVPQGDGAWFVAAGGGPAPEYCKVNTGEAVGYAVTYRWEVSGKVTLAGVGDGVPGVTINADCPSGGSTSTDKDGKYLFLVTRGPCTIKPEPPDGQTITPEKRALDVEGNIDHVDFELQGVLYFKAKLDLSGAKKGKGGLVKAGSTFTVDVTLKDVSKTEWVVVAPIYPDLVGNATGGALLPSGETLQPSSADDADPSEIVVLGPGEEQDFDSVIGTTASRALGTDDGGDKVSGGTRAYVQFDVPTAFILHRGDDYALSLLDPKLIEVAQGSTDKMTVSIDDSAPDRDAPTWYNAVWDISKGIVKGLWNVTWGIVSGLWQVMKLLGSAVTQVPTAIINYITLETELWQEAKDDPALMAQLTDSTTNAILVMYKEAPFLLKKIGDIRTGVESAIQKHFDAISEDYYSGDWDNAVTEWSENTTEVVGNVATLFLNPLEMAGAVSNVTIARIPALIKGVEAADTARFAAEAPVVEAALGSGETADEVGEVETALSRSYPGTELSLTNIAKVFGINATMMADLAEFCRANRVVVTLRSRAFEAIDLIERGLSVVKPAAIKLKTVSQIDLDWLGFPSEVAVDGQDVSSIGQVMFREPIYLSETCDATCALGELQDKLLSGGITKDSPEFEQVTSRWQQRYGEWVDKGNGYIPELQEAAAKGELTLDWHWGENQIEPKLTAGTPPQTVGFKMTAGPDGVSIPLVCPEWSIATKICSGTWKSVTGDVDLVSITAADGSALSDKRYVEILQKLGASSLDVQHPATATWYKQLNDGSYIFDATSAKFTDKAKYMMADKCCLMQVGADGVPREVMLSLKGSSFTSKNDYFLNYVGRELLPSP
ncbi:MAG TPA: hypothetical protein VME46_02860 [Acidimicrobiales bacterium]|nr:hypothetical protein [Acidimicrobiales bacterium]